MQGARGTADPDRLLVVESDPAFRRVLSAELEPAFARPAAMRIVAEAAEALALMRTQAFDLVIIDVDGLAGCERIADFARMAPSSIILAITRRGTVSGTLEALRAGADDFLVKPFPVARLAERYATCLGRRRSAPPRPDAAAAAETDFEGFIGASPAMRGVYEQIARIAGSQAPVFITGESGTGKELCAQAVHARSRRAEGPFLAINCSAIPKDLMESEIFGHLRGAFTGAVDDRPGAAVLADGGTLFLDEIGDMDLGLQAKLLRFIQTGSVRPLGGSAPRPVDVRFVCATNRDPQAEIAAGRFRQDLFYRLHVLPIDLPPLRVRPDDIAALSRSFLKRFAAEEAKAFTGFDREAEARLLAHPWPGNVRQLENVIRQVVVLHDGPSVGSDMLPASLNESLEKNSEFKTRRDVGGVGARAIAPFWRQEQSIIETALAAFDGNISRAAAALEIAPSTIYRKRQAWASRRTGAAEIG